MNVAALLQDTPSDNDIARRRGQQPTSTQPSQPTNGPTGTTSSSSSINPYPPPGGTTSSSPPSSFPGPGQSGTGGSGGGAVAPERRDMEYLCAGTLPRISAQRHSKVRQSANTDCGAKNEIKSREPIRCRECGHRIMYKKRTKRSACDGSVISQPLLNASSGPIRGAVTLLSSCMTRLLYCARHNVQHSLRSKVSG